MPADQQISSSQPIKRFDLGCEDHIDFILDMHSGDKVCTDCGLVIEDGLSPEENLCYFSNGDLKKSAEDHGFELLLRDKILMTCAYLGLDGNALLIETTLNLFMDLFKLRKKDNCSTQSKALSGSVSGLHRQLLEKEQNREYLAYSLWESLNRQGIAIMAYKVAGVCDVLPNSILRVEKKFKLMSTYCSLTEFVETSCNRIGFGFSLTKPVTQLADRIKCSYYGKNKDVVFHACLYKVYSYKKLNQPEDIDSFVDSVCCAIIKNEQVREILRTIPDIMILSTNDVIFKK